MVLQRSTVVVGKDLTRNLTADSDNALKAYVHFSGGSLNHSVSSQVVKNRRRNLMVHSNATALQATTVTGDNPISLIGKSTEGTSKDFRGQQPGGSKSVLSRNRVRLSSSTYQNS